MGRLFSLSPVLMARMERNGTDNDDVDNFRDEFVSRALSLWNYSVWVVEWINMRVKLTETRRRGGNTNDMTVKGKTDKAEEEEVIDNELV